MENIQQRTYIEERFEDGSYIEITIDYGISNARATTTKSKTATYKGADGTALWSVTVKGTFNYNGSSSTCTKFISKYKKLFNKLEIKQCKSFKKRFNSYRKRNS